MGGEKGVCPLCGAGGAVGQACHERVCERSGVHFVPAALADQGARRPAAARDSMIGQRIEQYLVTDLLGVGGFGRVYLAIQLPIGLKGALKVMDLRDDPTLAETMLRKFEGEAAALARLSHPNVVRLLRYGLHEGLPFLVMEFVEGARTLQGAISQSIESGERLSPAVVRHILRQICNALEAAHEQGIVHRDIKPANVMLQKVAGDDHFVRVLDFGIAKFIEERTETSLTVGTPMYMAPEQLDRRNLGPWTDLYAVGAIAFELMTGSRPFAGQSTREILARKLDPNYDPAARAAALGYPAPILELLRRSLARDPADRFQSASELRAYIDAVFAPGGAASVGGAWAPDVPRARGDTARGWPAPDDKLALAPTAVGGAVVPPPHVETQSGALTSPPRRRSLAAILAALVVGGCVVAALVIAGTGGRSKALRAGIAAVVETTRVELGAPAPVPAPTPEPVPQPVPVPPDGLQAAPRDAGAAASPDVPADPDVRAAVVPPVADVVDVADVADVVDAADVVDVAEATGPPAAGEDVGGSADAGSEGERDASTAARRTDTEGAKGSTAKRRPGTGSPKRGVSPERARHLWLSTAFSCRAISTMDFRSCRLHRTNKGYGIRFPEADIACEEVVFGSDGHPRELRGCRSSWLILPERNRLRKSRRRPLWTGSKKGWRWRHTGEAYCCPGMWLRGPDELGE